MSLINVDVASMQAAAQKTQAAHDGINTQLQTAQGDFADLSQTWGGEAATKFANVMQSVWDDSNVVLSNLLKITQDLEQSAGTYNNSSDSTSDAATSLGTQISGASTGLPGFNP